MNYNKAEFETAFGTTSQLPTDRQIEIAFAGRSNVGKSSLLNKLFNRKNLARVSSVPGKTATINFYKVDGIRFVDLPGYGYAKVSKGDKRRWAFLLESYFNTGRDIRLVVLLIDIRRPPSADDMLMVNFLKEKGYDFIAVLTKKDKLNKTEFSQRMESVGNELGIESERIIPFSAMNGDGLDRIKAIINEYTKE
ncbi:MAG: ribosome biogenesis GTP-binding protein YihA/YsxC [Clostridiales bacterium]|nr:ribosome biogenesis GTP-binding protein YihA/YsxC [Clostridiales bacterium]